MRPGIHKLSTDRLAFTLVEMLVVMALIVLLLALVLLFMPKRESRLANQGADQLQTYLASAKSRALRDQVPCGVRLIPSVGPNGVVAYREFQYVSSPDYYTPDQTTLTIQRGSNIAVFNSALGIDISESVQAGDLLQIMEGANLSYRVSAVSPNSVALVTAPSQAQFVNFFTANNYRFFRQPRPLFGEPTLQLPQYVYVSVSNSLNIPANVNNENDIIFAPSGQVINQSAGRIVLWLTDDNNVSEPTLLTIYTLTGGVAAHPIAPGGDPYAFTRDGNDSGQ